MATLTALDISDLVAGTLYELGRMKFQQIAQNLQHYEIFTHWFKKERMSFDGGIGIQRTLMNRFDASAAKHVGMTEADNVNITDLIDQLQVPWRHAQTSWGFFYHETLMNKGKEMIFKVIKPRRESAMLALVEELENKAWSAPSSTDKKNPYGIPYWLVKSASTGFNGGAPSGHSTVGGVSLTDSPNFKNYTAQYATVSKPDLIKKLRTAIRKCHFQSPLPGNSDYTTGSERYRMYVNETTLSSMEDIGESQNENLGRDLANPTYGGTHYGVASLIFRGYPIVAIPKLDADTQNPVYGVDHNSFHVVCLEGDYLRESENKAPFQHNSFQMFVDLTYNYLCVDRRRNFVLATA